MKQLVFSIRFILVIVITVLLNSCQQDEFIDKELHSGQDIKFKKVSVDDIMNKVEHRKFKTTFIDFKAASLTKDSNGNEAKLVYNEDLGLYIDDKNGIFIEKEEHQSYTFRIRRNESEEKLENIIFSSKPNGEFDIKIVTYDITYEEIEALGIDEITNRNVQYTPFNNYQSRGLPSLVCVQTWKLMMVPPDEGELTGGSIDYVPAWVLTSEDCSWVGGGGGGNGSGSSSGNGNGSGGNAGGGGGSNNGGSGNNNNPPIITTPIIKKPNTTPNPYPYLMELLNPQTYNMNYYINNLAIRYNQNEANEVSYSFKKETAFDGTVTYPAEFRTGTPTAVKILTGTHHTAIHLHPKSSKAAGGIFSWQDMRALYNLYNDAHPYRQEENEIALLVVCPNPTNNNNYNVYAIAVKNKILLKQAIDNEWLSTKWTKIIEADKRLEAIQDDLGTKYFDNRNNLEAFFLQYFSNYGISLYKLENNIWKQLGLTTAGNITIIPNN